jgi:hypothetical protein
LGGFVDGDTAMTAAKAKSPARDLKHNWPHHAALPAEKVRDPVNGEATFCAAGVFRLGKAEHHEALRWEAVATGSRR